jgi:alcohol dehydrogenase
MEARADPGLCRTCHSESSCQGCHDRNHVGQSGKKVALHLEQLWDRNVAITTRLVDTVSTPMLFKTVRSNKINPKRLITHRFKMDKILDAYDTFGDAAKTKALKVILEA